MEIDDEQPRRLSARRQENERHREERMARREEQRQARESQMEIVN